MRSQVPAFSLKYQIFDSTAQGENLVSTANRPRTVQRIWALGSSVGSGCM
jgi:hypothetical protein